MIFLFDTSECHEKASRELGLTCGQLLTPLTQRKRRSDLFAIDNGCFSSFDETAWISLLDRERSHASLCKFVTVPDVVCSARRTLEIFHAFAFRAELFGYTKALVIQNGQEDLPIPWEHIGAIFIGGDDRFKDSASCTQIIRAAQILKKWVHVGRVNGKWRFQRFMKIGVDSVDGTGVSRYTGSRLAVRNFLSEECLFEN